jgi:hypothetical protein
VSLLEARPQRLSLHGSWHAVLPKTGFRQLKRMLQTGALQLDIRGPALVNKGRNVSSADPDLVTTVAMLQRCYTVADAPQLPVMQYGSCKS